ncbi:MAG: sigma 54-interacting transcriptional regulator [Polyangiaceae bacterium]
MSIVTPAPTLEHSRYTPGATLGRGAQGVVIRVTDREQPSRPLVAKLLAAGTDAATLQGEFALLARQAIPGLVRAHDFGRDEASGAPFLVEDFVDGPDARQWLSTFPSGAKRIDALVDLAIAVAQTLGSLHEAGFVHGDLKPDHVRIPARGEPVLLDLGAAVRCSAHGAEGVESASVAYTLGYAAPELLAGAAPSPRTDLFALGALLHVLASGATPAHGVRDLRRRAPDVPAALEDLILDLVAKHPADRPRDCSELLGRLVHACPSDRRAPVVALRARSNVVREAELEELLRARAGVRYVTGEAGAGKSHLLHELSVQAALVGRPLRWLRFPGVGAELTLRLLAFLRGKTAAWPFDFGTGRLPLLIIDDVERGPAELMAALEAFRCRADDRVELDVIVGTRVAPPAADPMLLAPLSRATCARLCSDLGSSADPSAIWRASKGNLGWILATLAGVPLSREAIEARVRKVGDDARRALGAIAVTGGRLPERVLAAVLGASASRAMAELATLALIERHAHGACELREVALANPGLTVDLAEALAPHDWVDEIAAVLLRSASRTPVVNLLALARAPHAPTERNALLQLAAERARRDGLRAEQVDALLELCADPRQRTTPVLTELDRLTRGGGSAGLHPQLVDWLEELAVREPAVSVLALRRRAEQYARQGRSADAQALAERANALALERGDPAQRALASSTEGAVALYRSDWAAAERALARASQVLEVGAVDDAEEAARILHNVGVVALYRGQLEHARDAFQKALETKRALGDRAGLWACLLNLGLARSQAGELEQADEHLHEAALLCRSLGQLSGLSWCLAARAEVALRKNDLRTADAHISDAEHLGGLLPEPVRADLAILRSELSLLRGDAVGGRRELESIEADLRASDLTVDLKVRVLEARAHLVQLPADPRRAARLAVDVVRRARQAQLPEPERRALRVLADARARQGRPRARVRYDVRVQQDDALFDWLATFGRGAARQELVHALASLICRSSGAERAFIAAWDAKGRLQQAWGADLDGLPIAEAARRVDETAAENLGVVYQPVLDTAGGSGSRLVAVAETLAGRVGLIAEHRFVPRQFDGVAEGSALRWLTLATVALRADADNSGSEVDAPLPGRLGPAAEDAQRDARQRAATSFEMAPIVPPAGRDVTVEPSTVLPLRERTRTYATLIGDSPVFQRALDRLDAAVDSDLPVLISGETGVGKELFARALHDYGARSRGQFVAVNCGAIPDALFEAELFGHARGSFTGADRARPGLLSRAEGGTLFLDEIGELPMVRQAALLRALASRTYRPVGSDSERNFDVRIVAATNRDLEAEVEAGRFRRDLLYRINVLNVAVPSLRRRGQDVVDIAVHVLRAAGSHARITAAAAEAMTQYRWPGNVRELEHQMQRIAALGTESVELHHLSREIRGQAGKRKRSRAPVGSPEELKEVEAALHAAGGNITHAARKLAMTRHGLKKKMARLGLRSVTDSQARVISSREK